MIVMASEYLSKGGDSLRDAALCSLLGKHAGDPELLQTYKPFLIVDGIAMDEGILNTLWFRNTWQRNKGEGCFIDMLCICRLMLWSCL